MSYSAYLYHWPLLAFYRYGWGDVTLLGGCVIFLLTFLLAWLSYKHIETPVRKMSSKHRVIFVKVFVVPTILVALLMIAFMKLDGYGLRWFSNDYRDTLQTIVSSTKPANQAPYVCQSRVVTHSDANNDECVLGLKSSNDVNTILFGDSNASHYVGVIGAIAEHQGFAFRNLQNSSCPPIDVDAGEYAHPERVASCNASQRTIFKALDRYDRIIVSADWTAYQRRSEEFLNVFYSAIEQWTAKGKDVMIVGKAPVFSGYDRLCREKSISFPGIDCMVTASAISKDIERVNSALKAYASEHRRVDYFDLNDYLCQQALCSIYDEEGEVLYYDSSHISLNGSWQLGRRLVNDGLIPNFFNR